ncbi:hypothetical protein R1sor_027169 [Riccia sorocarpa]|uniref:Uncharacterized protein n=1 Tax=Riccia sorocarpa TaxID=122646 RepID=A0ABD3GF50_9MARC
MSVQADTASSCGQTLSYVDRIGVMWMYERYYWRTPPVHVGGQRSRQTRSVNAETGGGETASGLVTVEASWRRSKWRRDREPVLFRGRSGTHQKEKVFCGNPSR